MKPKKELTPKITTVRNTITKSTPFLIRKHHLDDSECKAALDFRQERHGPRSYSYQAERVRVKIPEREVEMVPVRDKDEERGEYYAVERTKKRVSRAEVGVQAHDAEYWKEFYRSRMEREIREMKHQAQKEKVKHEKVASKQKEAKQIQEARQAKRRESKEKSRIKREAVIAQNRIAQLQQRQRRYVDELDSLRVRTVQLERKLLEGQLKTQQCRLHRQTHEMEFTRSFRSRLLGGKPPFSPHSSSESFSSFQLP